MLKLDYNPFSWINMADIKFLGLMIFILPVNFGHEAASTGNLLAIPTFLLRFGTPLTNGLREISTYDQQVLNPASTCDLFAASLTAGFVSDIIGRKRTIVLAFTICVSGTFVPRFSTSIMMLFGGKFVSTFGFGLGLTLAPVYVAEITTDSIRGVCLALVVTNTPKDWPGKSNKGRRTA